MAFGEMTIPQILRGVNNEDGTTTLFLDVKFKWYYIIVLKIKALFNIMLGK